MLYWQLGVFYLTFISRRILDIKHIIIVIFLNFIGAISEFIRFPKNEPKRRIGVNNILSFIVSSVNNPVKKYPIIAMVAATILNQANISRNC